MEAEVSNFVMKNVRIIARLDIKGHNVIKGVHLECLRVVGDPEEMAYNYFKDGADELIYMDIVASLYGRSNLVEIVKKVAQNIYIPFTAGGGVRSIDDINMLLRAGADKVAINSHLIDSPDFVDKAVRIFGSQCIVGSIEAKKMPDGRWLAFYNNGREFSGKDAIRWAEELATRGVGELLITSIDKEGTRSGFDYELLSKISSIVSIPIIASGGAGELSDIGRVITSADVDAVAIASLLHYRQCSILGIKEYLFNCNMLNKSNFFIRY
jgi:cyclase